MAKAAAKSKPKTKRNAKSKSQDQDADSITHVANPHLKQLQEAWDARKPKTAAGRILRWLHVQKLRYDNMLGIPCFDTSEVIMLHCTLLLVIAFIMFGLYKNWLMLMNRFSGLAVSSAL